ncbi:ABC transporter ATP-binding protein [Brevibacterium aurantiacum]|uniref:Uncharacterized protein n=1 Tax=Brevibacterium aurantiacum TaxID=273384 RepID=A0A2A3ZSR2_BREAU|nr:ABC transporter ATP-binding protein [Brevibacterium aurantiacum]PCC54578.1 hypothetical protein CIK59_06065 [Brevibacterium aurantiacum]
MISGGAVVMVLISWAIGLAFLILVIAAGVRLGMRWSRKDERREQAARDEATSEPPRQPDFKPFRTGRNFK